MLSLATDNGLMICEQDNGWRIARRGLEGKRVTCVAVQSLAGGIASKGLILAGTTTGIFRSEDLGHTWNETSAGLTERHVRWLVFHPEVADLAFAGTEPASIFVSRDGGISWNECPEVPRLRREYGWFLPYSPEAGCVRGFAFHEQRGYAAVEVGGVLRSDDYGAHWRLADGSDGNPGFARPHGPLIHPDVHSLYVHPSSPDLVDASTGGGFYRSSDGGKTWELLYDCYCRSAWTDPADPAHLILGPAKGVSSHGRIEESRDGGRSWSMASSGLTVPWSHHMVERFMQIGTDLFAVLSTGELLWTPLATLGWKSILLDINKVNAVSADPEQKREPA